MEDPGTSEETNQNKVEKRLFLASSEHTLAEKTGRRHAGPEPRCGRHIAILKREQKSNRIEFFKDR